jgi:hypothetical protein
MLQTRFTVNLSYANNVKNLCNGLIVLVQIQLVL